jgi:hypothetical protein
VTFPDWYAANVANTFPPGMPDIAKQAARQAMAACWNAAIDEAARWIAAPAKSTEHTQLMANALKVTPINGEMRKTSQ